MPMPLVAETGQTIVSPPQPSGARSCSCNCFFTRSILTESKSILLIATMIFTCRRFGVTDCFECLRHQAIVGGDNEDDDVGDIGAAGAHRGKGRVAGSVDESDFRDRKSVV